MLSNDMIDLQQSTIFVTATMAVQRVEGQRDRVGGTRQARTVEAPMILIETIVRIRLERIPDSLEFAARGVITP